MSRLSGNVSDPSLTGGPIDPEVLKRVYDEAVIESVIIVLLHTVASQTVLYEAGRRIEGVQNYIMKE